MDAHDLNLDRPGLALLDLALTPSALVIRPATTAATATCPRCGAPSDRVHSHYTRTVADLSAHHRLVVLRLRVRRLRCVTPDCVNDRAKLTHYRSSEIDPPGVDAWIMPFT
jgi:hypothetical protein